MMHAFLFGDSKKPLYGVYHPAFQSLGIPEKSVLLCPPLGHEYMRSHWAFRILAETLSRQGCHCLRFDYHATGDSSGQSVDGNVEQWIEDIQTGLEELKNLSGMKKTAMVGIRFGAALAMKAVGKGLTVDDLVLWDPVVFGEYYLHELRQVHNQRILQIKGYIKFWMGMMKHMPQGELMGFPLSKGLINEIRQMDLTEIQCPNLKRIHMIISEKTRGNKQFRQYLESTFPAVQIVDVRQQPGNWSSHDDVGQALFANDIIHEITKVLKS